MNEQRYKKDDLQDYKGILISQDRHSGRFRMELKVEDNPIFALGHLCRRSDVYPLPTPVAVNLPLTGKSLFFSQQVILDLESRSIL